MGRCLVGGGRQARGANGGTLFVAEDGGWDGIANDLFATRNSDGLGDVSQVLVDGSDVAAREGARPFEAAPILSVVSHHHHSAVSLR